MPSGQVLVALCASRCGLSIGAYAASRTWREFALDVQSWLSSWATPAAALSGAGGGEKAAGKSPARSMAVDRTPSGRPKETRAVVPLDLMDQGEMGVAKLRAAIGSHTKAKTAQRAKSWIKAGGMAAVKSAAAKPKA